MASPLYPTDAFVYQYLAGPVNCATDLDIDFDVGNCRFALQLYFYRVHSIFLEKDDIYLPGGYKTLGTFIYQEEPIEFDNLESGDIVYAQNLCNKNGIRFSRNIENYQSKDEWIYHLHSAIFIGHVDESDNLYIWHATSIAHGPILWTIEEFCQYYKPISVKRIPLEKRSDPVVGM